MALTIDLFAKKIIIKMFLKKSNNHLTTFWLDKKKLCRVFSQCQITKYYVRYFEIS